MQGMITLALNILWFVLGGVLAGLGWLLATVLMVLSIVGIPWARASFNIALFSFWPFGRTAIDRAELTGRGDLGTSPLGTLGNIVWFVLAGWWLALTHLGLAIGLAVTIIGIPFAWQHLKLAGVSLFPVGKTIVEVEVAEAARRRAAARAVEGWRG